MYRLLQDPELPSPNWFEAYAQAQLTPRIINQILYDPYTQYLSSMYWAFTTMTTVGCAPPQRLNF